MNKLHIIIAALLLISGLLATTAQAQTLSYTSPVQTLTQADPNRTFAFTLDHGAGPLAGTLSVTLTNQAVSLSQKVSLMWVDTQGLASSNQSVWESSNPMSDFMFDLPPGSWTFSVPITTGSYSGLHNYGIIVGIEEGATSVPFTITVTSTDFANTTPNTGNYYEGEDATSGETFVCPGFWYNEPPASSAALSITYTMTVALGALTSAISLHLEGFVGGTGAFKADLKHNNVVIATVTATSINDVVAIGTTPLVTGSQNLELVITPVGAGTLSGIEPIVSVFWSPASAVPTDLEWEASVVTGTTKGKAGGGGCSMAAEGESLSWPMLAVAAVILVLLALARRRQFIRKCDQS